MLASNAALIVIDVQKGFDEARWGQRNNPDAEANIARLIAAWRTTGRPVHHVHHASVSPEGAFRPDGQGHLSKPEAKPAPGEPVHLKRVNSAFIGTTLERDLLAGGVRTVVVIGLTTNHCVSTSVRMAGNLGFETFVVSDATAAFDSRSISGGSRSAGEVHANALADLDGEFATVVLTAELLDRLAVTEGSGSDHHASSAPPALSSSASPASRSSMPVDGENGGHAETAVFTVATSALANLSGTGLPTGTLFQAALDWARRASAPWLFNHVVRSWLFATHVARDTGVVHDSEIVALGALLHDLGLSDTYPGPHRFEVNGANAALEWLFVEEPTMCRHRLQLIWDCIALHSTGSIARHKQVEVALVNAGIAADYGGAGLVRIDRGTVDAILEAYPRLDMKRQFCACLCSLAATRPASTYGTWVADFGHRFVDSYRAPSSVDALFDAPFDA